MAMRSESLSDRFKRLSPGRKFILTVFLIWLAQALPKWTAAVTADGELSAQIMKMFVTPRAEARLSTSLSDRDLDNRQSAGKQPPSG